MAKNTRGSRRPKQDEMPLEGAGVEPVKDKKLIALGDEFIDTRDEKASLATKLKDIEKKILERMDVLNLKVFRFSDQIVAQKEGARHVKVKTVRVDDDASASDDAPVEGSV